METHIPRLWSGDRAYEIRPRSAWESGLPPGAAIDRHVALALLRRLARDPGNASVLRGVMARETLAGAATRTARGCTNDDIVELLARRIASGALTLLEAPRSRLDALDGDGETVSEPPPEAPVAEEKDWVEIELTEEDGTPVAGEPYEITLPGGSVRKGTLDKDGFARQERIPGGSCTVTFPERDRRDWARRFDPWTEPIRAPLGPPEIAAGSPTPVFAPSDWLTIELHEEDGTPAAYEVYEVHLPGGSTLVGTLDFEGRARIAGIAAGDCLVSFPDLDGREWRRA